MWNQSLMLVSDLGCGHSWNCAWKWHASCTRLCFSLKYFPPTFNVIYLAIMMCFFSPLRGISHWGPGLRCGPSTNRAWTRDALYTGLWGFFVLLFWGSRPNIATISILYYNNSQFWVILKQLFLFCITTVLSFEWF